MKGKNRETGFTYVDKAGYNKFSQRVYLKLGNGVETKYAYDENRRWLKGIRTTQENTVLQDIQYSFDPVGNVLGYENNAGGYQTKQTYAYDSLYQLTGVNGESQSRRYGLLEYTAMYGQQYQFDNAGLGNMTLKSSHTANNPPQLLGDNLNYQLDYEYEKGCAHRAARIGSRYYRYDLNGSVTGVQDGPFETEAAHGNAVVNNLGNGAYYTEGGWALDDPKTGGAATAAVSSSLREYRWDERNRMQYSGDGRFSVKYTYGEDGERTGKWAVSHAGGESETLYFGKLWSWHYDGIVGDYTGMNSTHIFLGDTRIATKAVYADGSFIESAHNEQQYYYHSDHLGSAQLITDYKGDEYERVEYTPYGELWIEKAAADSLLDVPYRFTGKERDKETGLYYYGARYLDPRDSRWLSVDPAVGEYVPSPGQEVGKLPGMGGVFNTVNLHVYHYAGNNPVKYVDPDGETATYSIDDENKIVTINLDIIIYGKNASKNIAQEYKDRIMEQWGKDDKGNQWQMDIGGEKYSLNFNVNVMVGPKPSLFNKLKSAFWGTTNWINVDNSCDRPYVALGSFGTWITGDTPQRYNQPLSVDNIPAHEAGHLLGFKDRYKNNSSRTSVPHHGWESNLMASTYKRVEQKNIDSIGSYISGRNKSGILRSMFMRF